MWTATNLHKGSIVVLCQLNRGLRLPPRVPGRWFSATGGPRHTTHVDDRLLRGKSVTGRTTNAGGAWLFLKRALLSRPGRLALRTFNFAVETGLSSMPSRAQATAVQAAPLFGHDSSKQAPFSALPGTVSVPAWPTWSRQLTPMRLCRLLLAADPCPRTNSFFTCHSNARRSSPRSVQLELQSPFAFDLNTLDLQAPSGLQQVSISHLERVYARFGCTRKPSGRG